MNESDHGHSLLLLLIQHEEALSSLYGTCGLRFPDHVEFWQTLVFEERAHADVLKELSRHLETQEVSLNERKFNVTGIQTAINHVNKQQQITEAGLLTIIQAMAIALDIERAIIEREFFEIFETDSPLIKREFDYLKKHTNEHIARIAGKLDQLRT